MIDQETKSLWSHLLGRAMHGPLLDTELAVIPSAMTSWKQWRITHPTTSVVKMERSSTAYGLEAFHADDQLLIGMARGEQARAWVFREFKESRAVNETVFQDQDGTGGIPVVVAYDKDRVTAVIHGRRVAGELLNFRLEDGVLRDESTDSQWDLLTGTATAGPLEGRVLPKINGIVSIVEPWTVFHPKSTYWLEQPSEGTDRGTAKQ